MTLWLDSWSIYPKETKTKSLHKTVYMKAHSSFICHSLISEAQMSCRRWASCQVHPYHRKLDSVVKGKELRRHATTWMALKRIFDEQEKASLKGYTLYDSIYVTVSKWHNYGEQAQTHGCQQMGGFGGALATPEDRTVLQLIVVMVTSMYTRPNCMEVCIHLDKTAVKLVESTAPRR